jgi:hypothetical protein
MGKAKRRIGGSIYRSNRHSKALTIKWYVHGKAYTEAAGTSDNRKAENMLKARIKDADSGIIQSTKSTVGDLIRSYIDSLKVDRVDYYSKVEDVWRRHLSGTFANVKANYLTTDMLRSYVTKRQSEEIVVRSKLKTGEVQESKTGKFPQPPPSTGSSPPSEQRISWLVRNPRSLLSRATQCSPKPATIARGF